ncbi:malate dehydrogenase [candidate division FCPU426 bacterium]|nr:malate dehydrogenase [candidate division FCPU426 bacterium]
MPRKKITVIGAGNVGAAVAQQILAQHLGDVVMVDIAEGMAKGKALDLNQSAPILGYQGRVEGTQKYEETIDSDVIVVTSGSPRKPGMSRDDLLRINFDIVHTVVGHAAAASPEAVMILITNPLDLMTYTALKTSKYNTGRVVGMAGVLDSARYRFFLSAALSISPHVIEAMVLGGHGDDMVPCAGLTRVGGAPVESLLPAETLSAIIQRTRDGGGEIVKLLQSGSAYYAPAASAVRMVSAVLNDEKALLPCATLLQGEYGFRDIVLGVPVVLGAQGVERILEIPLKEQDRAALSKSAAALEPLCRQIDQWLREKE